MNFSALGTSLQQSLGENLLGIVGALGILIVGWIVAVLARAGLRRLLAFLKVDARITESTGQSMRVEWGLSLSVFWLIMLVTLIGMFNSLDLPLVSGPFELLVGDILGYLPRFVAGTLLLLLAWVVATLLRAGVNRVLAATGLDQKLAAEAGMDQMSKGVGNVLFWR